MGIDARFKLGEICDSFPLDRPIYGFDIETQGIDPRTTAPASAVARGAKVVAWSLAWHRAKFPDVIDQYFSWGSPGDVLCRLPIVGHNLYGFDAHLVKGLNIVADTLRMSRLLKPSNQVDHSLKGLIKWNLGWEIVGEYSELFGLRSSEAIQADPVLCEIFRRYAAKDAAGTLALYSIFSDRLVKEPWHGTHTYLDFHNRFWNRSCRNIHKMESRGVPVDLEYLERCKYEAEKKVREEEAKLRAWKDINWNSHKQVSEFLRDELKLPNPPIKGSSRAIHKAETGKFSTSESSIQWLLPKEPRLQPFSDFRRFGRILSFCTSLPKHVVEGRIYTALAPDTETGRLSSKNPNLQQIPAPPDPLNLRGAFRAPQGKKLLIADYSQLEIHILAHFVAEQTGDVSLVADLQSGDVYDSVGGRIGRNRKTSKVVVLATNYGKTPQGMALQLGISVKEAERLLESYLRSYPGIYEFQQHSAKEAQDTGRVRTLLGRYRDLGSVGTITPRIARQAVNTKIQGSAAEIALAAMNELEDQGLPLILSVHDELIAEVWEDEVDCGIKLMKEVMENPLTKVELCSKLVVSPKAVDNWGEAK